MMSTQQCLARKDLLLCLVITVVLASDSGRRIYAFDQVLVSHRGRGTIQRYSAAGQFLDEFGGAELIGANGMKLGPTGLLYVADEVQDRVLRYDPLSGDFLGVFAVLGEFSFPVGITFGPNGDLYSSACTADSVERFDGETGAFISTFASGGGLFCPIQPTFGPDGELYVTGVFSNSVTRYDGNTGAFKEVFAFGNGIDRATALEFGPDGNMYVGSQNTSQIKRFNGQTGEFIDDFITGSEETLHLPEQIHFGPNGDLLYVSDLWTGSILRYDASSGEFLDVFITTPFANNDSLRDFVFLTTVPEPTSLNMLACYVLIISIVMPRCPGRRTRGNRTGTVSCHA